MRSKKYPCRKVIPVLFQLALHLLKDEPTTKRQHAGYIFENERLRLEFIDETKIVLE